MRFPVLLSLAASLLATVPASARTLTTPDDATVAMLRSFVTGTPPDYEALAAASKAVQDADEFDRADTTSREVERLRREYLSMGEVDRVVLRLRDELGEYDADVGGFRFQAFLPDRFVKFGPTTLTFDNHDDFAIWRLSVAEAKSIVRKVRSGRAVRLEVVVLPFAGSTAREGELRSQVREVRILSAAGAPLGVMTTDAPEAHPNAPASSSSAAVLPDRLDVLGLKIGDGPDAYRDWAKSAGLEAQMAEPPFIYDFVASYQFTAVPNRLPTRSTVPLPPRFEVYPPIPGVDVGFTCGGTVDRQRLCGVVAFSGEHDVSAKRVLSIRMAQSVVGRSVEEVAAKLAEKYGPATDAFDTMVDAAGEDHRARMFVWGAGFPRDADTSGAAVFVRQKDHWPVEAVLFQPEANRVVLLLQVIAPPASTDGDAGEVRL